MKRIKSVNGYTIYEAVTQRDEDTYNCHVGEYNIYLSSDIRDFGLSNSYPEYESIDSLSVAEAMCGASQYAVAVDLAEELSSSTVQDMDLVLEIERLLEDGLSIEEVRACYGDLIDETELAPRGLSRGGATARSVEYIDGSEGIEEPHYSVYYEGEVFPGDYYKRGGIGIKRNYDSYDEAEKLYDYCRRADIPVWLDDNRYGVTLHDNEWN